MSKQREGCTMSARHFETIVLDYGDARAAPKLISSLSTIVCNGNFLWSAADEGRTIECLKMDGDRYTLHRQVRLDNVFTNIPGKKNDEVDIESIDIAGGRLWICGSHCHVREMCCLDYRGAEGILILYDSPDHRRRIRANCYIADWFRLPD